MNPLKSFCWVGVVWMLSECSPAEKPKPVNANPLEGTWVISITSQKAYLAQHTGPFTPFGFDFSNDSVEVFCRPIEGERYATYTFSKDTLTIRGSDNKAWIKSTLSASIDTLRVFRTGDTLIYRRVNMDSFKAESLKRVFVSAAAWSMIIGLTFDKDGSLEVASNGYGGDKRALYEFDKIYKLNKSPLPFGKVSRSLQRLHFIARSEPGRQLLDSAQQTCFDGAQYGVLFESDSLKEVSYTSCSYEFEFFQYSEYLIQKLQLQNVPARGAVAYDSIFESPLFYCGHVWDSLNRDKKLTPSEQLYLARYLRSGKQLDRTSAPLPISLINFCGDREYGKALRTNGRIFRIPIGKKITYIDAGNDLLAAIAAAKKEKR